MKHFFSLLLAVVLLQHVTKAQCLDNWQYAIPITVNNGTNSDTLTDYQIILSVTTDTIVTNGKMEASGADIRFSMNGCCNQLCYNIESGMNSNATIIAVKIPQILPFDSVTINMHYGNPNASAADDADCVYEFWDDFNDNNFDLTKWELRGNPNIVESGGTMTLNGFSNWAYCRSITNFNQRVLIRESRRQGAGTSHGPVVGFTATDNRYGFYMPNANLATLWDDNVTGGASQYDANYPAVPSPGNTFTDYTIDMEVNNSNQIRVHEFCNTTTSNCNSNLTDFTQFTGGNSFYVGYTSWTSAHTSVVDWIYVTKRTDTVPTITIGAEVTATPGPISLGNDTAFCQGDSLTLTPTGNWPAYAWSTNDTTPTINVNSSGNYSVTVTNEIGCDIVDSVVVDVNPLPDASFTSTNTGTTYNFTNTEAGGSSWAWDFGNGDTSSLQNPIYTYGSEGDYLVCLTVVDTNGCEDTFCDSVNAAFPVGLNEVTIAESVSVFPNPASEVLNVDLSKYSKQALIEVYSIQGKLLLSANAMKNSIATINTASLSNGNYILKIVSGMETHNKRFSVNR